MTPTRPTRRRVLSAAGLGLATGLAGCTASTSNDPDPDEPDASGGFPVEGDFELPTDPDDEHFVDLTGQPEVEIETIQRDEQPRFVFDPPFVTVDAGSTVRWVNRDGVFHTVTFTETLDQRRASGEFDDRFASDGETIEWEPAEPGDYPYYCSPHVGFMYGVIRVV